MYVVVAAAVLLFVSGLLLMGFKPKSSLKRYHHVKPAHFIYPDEKVTRAPFTSSWSLVVWDSPPQSYLRSAIGRGGDGRRWGLRYCLAWSVMRVGSSVRGSDEGGRGFQQTLSKTVHRSSKPVHPDSCCWTFRRPFPAVRRCFLRCCRAASRGAWCPFAATSPASGPLRVLLLYCLRCVVRVWNGGARSLRVGKRKKDDFVDTRVSSDKAGPAPVLSLAFPPSHFPPSPTLPSFLEPTRSPQRCAHRLLFH